MLENLKNVATPLINEKLSREDEVALQRQNGVALENPYVFITLVGRLKEFSCILKALQSWIYGTQ